MLEQFKMWNTGSYRKEGAILLWATPVALKENPVKMVLFLLPHPSPPVGRQPTGLFGVLSADPVEEALSLPQAAHAWDRALGPGICPLSSHLQPRDGRGRAHSLTPNLGVQNLLFLPAPSGLGTALSGSLWHPGPWEFVAAPSPPSQVSVQGRQCQGISSVGGW